MTVYFFGGKLANLQVRRFLIPCIILLYIFFNLKVGEFFFGCVGERVAINDTYEQKIKDARSLFTKNLNIPEPKYYIQNTNCYNAVANFRSNEITISKRLMDDFSTEDLAGILGHEFAHLVSKGEKVEHWQADVKGAEFTSKKIQLNVNTKMISVLNDTYQENRLLFNIALALKLTYMASVTGLESRTDKIVKFAK